MQKLPIEWIRCTSKSDLESRLAGLPETSTYWLVTPDVSSYGLLRLPAPYAVTVSVEYADIGTVPEAIVWDRLLLVGLNEVVVGLDASSREKVFEYRMPTAFHEFVQETKRGVLLRDEIGFVELSATGNELWQFCCDVIEDFAVQGQTITVRTLEGELFNAEIPG